MRPIADPYMLLSNNKGIFIYKQNLSDSIPKFLSKIVI